MAGIVGCTRAGVKGFKGPNAFHKEVTLGRSIPELISADVAGILGCTRAGFKGFKGPNASHKEVT